MKRFLFFLVFLVIVTSIILIVMSNGINQRFQIEKPIVLKNVQAYPICFLADGKNTYNPSFPYKNEMDEFYLKDNITVVKKDGVLNLIFDKEIHGKISYEIIQSLSKEIAVSKTIKDNKIISTGDIVKAEIQLENLKNATNYVLKLKLINDGEETYYYFNIYTGDINQEELIKTAIKAHELMFKGDRDYKKYIPSTFQNQGSFYNADLKASEDALLWKELKNYVKMNEPIPQIISYNPKTNILKVLMKFTVAIRKEYNFEYWDFTETYYIDTLHKDGVIKEYQRHGNRKNEPYFDNNKLQWVLDEGVPYLERENLVSENEQYQAFVYKNEIYLLDTKYNTLQKIFGFDSLDSDYLLDEDDKHNIELLDIDNKGNIKYLVYGYMPGGKYLGYNGILVNDYNNKNAKNETNLFIKINYGYRELNYYISNYSYYDSKNELFYINLKEELFQLSLKEKTFSNLLTLAGDFKISKEGIIYFENNVKDNMGVRLINLNANKEPNIINITYENTNIKLLGMIENAAVIGIYDVKNTYEYLNGKVFYPFDEIKIVDFNGNTIQTITANENRYFGDVDIIREKGLIYASQYYLSKQISSNPTASKVKYEKIDTQEIYSFTPKKLTHESILENTIVNGKNTILIKNKGTSLNDGFVPIASNGFTKENIIDGDINKNNKIYEIYSNNNLIGASSKIEEALKLTSNYQATSLYLNEGKVRKEIYNSIEKEKMVQLKVPIILQRPELIRGCESTALAMFLSYYTNEDISKLKLAERLRKDDSPMKIIDGIIHFGDMHKGFVGSMTDRSQPGLGVYIEPVYELAKNYIDGVYNITGSSLEQVLGMVSQGRPVLIIMPANYNKVSDRILQHWQTPSGFMEVTYLEHSAVISGYDDNYIYLNDPHYSTVIKRNISEFKAGWEDMGSQAVVVIQ